MFNSEYEKELKELGMSPAEIKAAVAEAKELKTKTTELQGKYDNLNTELETTKSSYADIKGRLDSLEANPTRQRKSEDGETKKKTSFLDDEDAAFNERATETMAPIAAVAMNAAKSAARMSAKNSLFGQKISTPGGQISLTNLWDKWLPEIDKAANEMAKTNVVALQYEQTWLNLFQYIKGQHIEELMAKPETFFESVASGADRKVGDDKKPDTLDSEQSAIAKKMERYGKGVTSEKILEARKKMNFVTS
jgi:chromosome segregation ATPase